MILCEKNHILDNYVVIIVIKSFVALYIEYFTLLKVKYDTIYL